LPTPVHQTYDQNWQEQNCIKHLEKKQVLIMTGS
jgi:hypothetical protein